MADAVCASQGALVPLLAKLTALLADDRGHLKRAGRDIRFLRSELTHIHAVLRKSMILKDPDVLVKTWMSKVRELSYDIEDCIDRFIHHLDDCGRHGGFKEFIGKIAQYLKAHRSRHGIADQIHEVKAYIQEVKDKMSSFRLERPISSSIRQEAVDPRLVALYDDATQLVGIDGPRDDLANWLVDAENSSTKNRRVLSIVGFGGLGKTTLAHQVYQKIHSNFHCCAFVSISQKPDIKNIIKQMIRQVSYPDGFIRDIEYWDEEICITKMRELLQDKRYLIVIDDIWSKQVWGIMDISLPNNHHGSRIIITTRIVDVAESCSENVVDLIHHMSPMSDEDSQKLFVRRIFGSDCPPHLENISARILKRCGGIPLAIISISSMLANRPAAVDQWTSVLNSIHSQISMSGLRMIVSLSISDLPYHLRTCLFYLSIFPEDYIIERDRLVWRWIAEGFIPTVHGYTSEQVAIGYFNELINKSMIQPVDIQYDSVTQGCQVLRCRVHDILLDLIVSLSTKVNFVTIAGQQEKDVISVRRLALQSNDDDKTVEQMSRESLSHVRSLNPFGYVRDIPYLGDFQALRVLDLASCRYIENHHIENIGRLFQLKYLDLYHTAVTELPEEIGYLKYLETIDLRGCGVKKLPATVSRLQQLQRLLVDKAVTLPDEIGKMQALEMLLSASMSCNSHLFLEGLGKLIQMRTLEITFGKPADMVDEVRTYTESFVSSLNKLGNLESLKICAEQGSCLDSLMEECLALQRLQKLVIDYISGLPKWIKMLQNVVHLELKIVMAKLEDLHTLGGIDTLLYLKLKLKHTPKEMLVVGSQGFQCLQEFHFTCWKVGTALVFAAGAMPKLRTLHLCLGAREAISKYGDFGGSIQHLSRLKNLHAQVDCCDFTRKEVESMEASIMKAADKHLNKLILEIRRRSEAHMVLDEDRKDVPEKSMRRRQIKRVTRVRVAFRARADRRKWNMTSKNRITPPSTTT